MASEVGAPADAPIFGVSAEFASARALLASVNRLRTENLGRLEAYTPVPVPGLAEALGETRSLAPATAAAVVLGFAGMMGMCIYATAYDYVFDIGGRPLVSWPAFIVPSVSFAMLIGALAVYLAMLFTNRLPHLNHPSFNIPGFTRASQDRFFLLVTAQDETLDAAAVERMLGDLPDRPVAIAEVPR